MTVAEQNFQPQTRDTTNGPNLHTYVPRSDGAIMVGNVAYFPEGYVAANATAAAATIPVVVQPRQPASIMQPLVYPPPYTLSSYLPHVSAEYYRQVFYPQASVSV